jgi:hypothetical protein
MISNAGSNVCGDCTAKGWLALGAAVGFLDVPFIAWFAGGGDKERQDAVQGLGGGRSICPITQLAFRAYGKHCKQNTRLYIDRLSSAPMENGLFGSPGLAHTTAAVPCVTLFPKTISASTTVPMRAEGWTFLLLRTRSGCTFHHAENER